MLVNLYFALMMFVAFALKPFAPALAKRIEFRTLDRVLPYPLTDDMLNDWSKVATASDRKRIDNIRHGNRLKAARRAVAARVV